MPVAARIGPEPRPRTAADMIWEETRWVLSEQVEASRIT